MRDFMKNKKTLMIASGLLGMSLTHFGLAADQKNCSRENNYCAPAISSNGVPLNAFGAVASSAKVPREDQVPEAPSNLKLPNIVPANTMWKNEVVQPPNLKAKSYLLEDAKTGNVIVASNPNKRVAPASLTKMMLLYIIEQKLSAGELSLDQKVRVPSVAWHTSGSAYHVKEGQKVTIQDLIEGVIVASGNDAAVTLAIQVFGSQDAAVKHMNFAAKQLGMNNTHFTTVMGLPAPNQYTSAVDLAKLAQHLIYDFPEYYKKYYNIKSVTMNGITTPNYNKLLNMYQPADGIKTGSTDTAGYSLVSSAEKDDSRRLIVVMLGASNMTVAAQNSKALYQYGFGNFTTKTIFDANHKLDSIRVYKGKYDDAPIGLAQPLNLTYPKALDPSQFEWVAKKNPDGLTAPVNKGDQAGTLKLNYQDKTIHEYPIVLLKDDPVGSWWQRLKGTVAQWF